MITIRPFNQHHNVRRRAREDKDDLFTARDTDDDEICEHLPTADKKTRPSVAGAGDRGDWVIHA